MYDAYGVVAAPVQVGGSGSTCLRGASGSNHGVQARLPASDLRRELEGLAQYGRVLVLLDACR